MPVIIPADAPANSLVSNGARVSGTHTTEELLHLYALEGSLARSPGSAIADRLVLKGGMLLVDRQT